jgi:hypothetical protein
MVLPGLAAMLVLAIMPRLTKNRGGRASTSPATLIIPERWSMGFCAVFFGAIAILAVTYPFIDRSVPEWAWWISGAGFGLFGLQAALALTNDAAVEWTESAITGPARQWYWTPHIPRNQVSWLDVRACGATTLGYWFLESRDGRRVYWSYVYRGWGALRDEIVKRRPDLKVPEKMRSP